MSTKIAQLHALARICRDFGGTLAIISQNKFDRLFSSDRSPRLNGDRSESPFTSAHGLWWSKRIVYAVEGREEVGSIIHEMGHVFADRYSPDHHKCREWNWLGWEIVMARKVNAYRTWSRQNANYSTNERGGDEWGALTRAECKKIVSSRLAHARKIGVVDTDGHPRSIR